jgi:hypothetical protein
MDREVISFAGVMLTIVASIASLAAIYIGVKWGLGASKSRETSGSRLHDNRLEQLQQSVDSIAIEVERIAEAQRFVAKLMAERAEVPRLPR